MKKLLAVMFGVVLGVGVATADDGELLLEGAVGYGVASGKALPTEVAGPVYTFRVGVKNERSDGYIVYRRMLDLYNDGYWREDVVHQQMGLGVRFKDGKQFAAIEGGATLLDVDVEVMGTSIFSDQWRGAFIGASAGTFIGKHLHLEMSIQGHAMEDDLIDTTAMFSIGANL